jgi:hypothetical protein
MTTTVKLPCFSVSEKRGSHLFFGYFKNTIVFWDTLVLKIFLRAKHLKVFNTILFLETAVFLEYFNNNELPNGA